MFDELILCFSCSNNICNICIFIFTSKSKILKTKCFANIVVYEIVKRRRFSKNIWRYMHIGFFMQWSIVEIWKTLKIIKKYFVFLMFSTFHDDLFIWTNKFIYGSFHYELYVLCLFSKQTIAKFVNLQIILKDFF